VFGLAFNAIPGFRLLRIPTRPWLFAGLAVAILAGLGANQLTSPELRQSLERNRGRLLKGVGIYLAGGAAGLAGYWAIFHHWHWLLTLQLLAVMGMAGMVAGWLAGKIDGRVLGWMLVPFVLVDLLPVAASYIDLIEPRRTFLEATPEFDFVSSQPGLFRVHSPLGTLSFALAAERRVEILEGLLSFQIDHAVTAIREATGCIRPGYATSVPICLDDIEVPSGRPDAQRLGELNVRYVITPQTLPARDFKLVFSHEDQVYENLRWQPRARLLPEGTASIVARQAGEYSITTDSPQSATLIVSETWLPGWQAALDGQPIQTERANDVFIGVRVPAGVHQVRLNYDPLGWRIGWPISAVSLAGLAIWIGVELRRRRAFAGPVSPQAKP
jgi:hypothetical protein